jgi:RNA polymerase sigma-70 factor (ECF subfamily)
MRSVEAGALSGADDAAAIHASVQDPGSFAELFDRHAAHIHRYLARRVGREAAEDLVAETFLIAFAKRQQYDLRYRDARPWLYGIATNLIGQHRRAETRNYRLQRALGSEPSSPDHASRIAADVTAASARAALGAALAELLDGDRDVLLLVACEQLTYEEAGRALGIPVGTVRSRMNRARASVRQTLTEGLTAAVYEEILSNE